MNNPTPDVDLWSRLKASDREAYSALYERYVGLLYNYASKICKDRALIQDAIQDLFIDLWKYREHLAATTSVKYYLYHSLRSRLFRSLAKSGAWSFYEGVSWDDVEGLITASPENDHVASEDVDEQTRRIRKYLHNLSPRQYEAIVLRFYDDFSYEEIAGMMDANPQSIRNLIQRALVQLRQYRQSLISLTALLTVLF